MAQNAPLTVHEIDEFGKKLKETVALAEQALALRETLSKFGSFNLPAVAHPHAHAPAAKPVAKPAAKVAKAPKAARKGPGKHKRQPGIPTDRVAEAMKGAKPMSLADVASKLGESNKDRVAAALRKLRASKKAKVDGDRQFAKWSLV